MRRRVILASFVKKSTCGMCEITLKKNELHEYELCTTQFYTFNTNLQFFQFCFYSYFSCCYSNISWCSKKQEVVAQSTAEAEFIVVNQALWLWKIMIDLQLEQKGGTEIFVDNQAVIAISQNPVFHGRIQPFSIKYYFLRKVQKNGEVMLVYCKTKD